MGPGSPLAVARVGRDDNRFSLEHQPAAVGNDRRLRSLVSGLLFTMDGATPTCRAVSARGDSDHALACVGPRGAGSTTYDNQPAGALRPTMPGSKSAVTIRPGALPPDPNELWRTSLSHPRGNRDRGESRDSSPPTPPDVRVRIRRFGGLSRPRHRDGSQAKGPQGASG